MTGQETAPDTPQDSLKPRFFGKVTASVSHEIQNVLAIVKENAGLMEDLIMMAMRKGEDVPVERLVGCLELIKKQAVRGTGLTSNLNGFAHTTDHDFQRVDIVSLAHCLLALTGRLAENVGVTMSVTPCNGNVPINHYTDPVQFQAVLHLSMECLFSTVPSGTAITFDFSGNSEANEDTPSKIQVAILISHAESALPDIAEALPSVALWKELIRAVDVLGGNMRAEPHGLMLTFE